jgi:multidrug efflux pump subunit AcrA (membrane-fusion protein)
MPRDTPHAASSFRLLKALGFLIAIGAIAVVATGISSRERASDRLREWTEAQAIPTVAVAAPSTGTLSPYLNLPGRLEAFSRAPIYARVSGYVKS